MSKDGFLEDFKRWNALSDKERENYLQWLYDYKNRIKREHSRFTFKFDDGQSISLDAYQSPRSVRHENKRPNLVVIDCYVEATQLELFKFARYIETLAHSMGLQKEQ